MITLTEEQITYFSLVIGFILFILALYIVEKWTKKETWALREKIVVPLLTISTLFLAINLFIADLPLNTSTATTSTKIIYNGKNADDSTITRLKHSNIDYYRIKRTHYAPTDTRLVSTLKEPITHYNETILTIPSKTTIYDQDYPIKKVNIKGNGYNVSKLTLITHKRIYKHRWSLFARVENTYDLTVETTV